VASAIRKEIPKEIPVIFQQVSSGSAGISKEIEKKTTGGKEIREYDDEVDSDKCYNERKETKQSVIQMNVSDRT
jgi:hypothetical protein